MRFFLLCVLFLFPFSQTYAQEERATVRVDGRALFRVGALEGKEEPKERARQIERRLNSLLENPQAIGCGGRASSGESRPLQPGDRSTGL